ncbi:MAG: hypothetical protein HY240_06335 [Actinobacteria bacterium]|nr:hypothetical protein [Actinomycetota bacterium]
MNRADVHETDDDQSMRCPAAADELHHPADPLVQLMRDNPEEDHEA